VPAPAPTVVSVAPRYCPLAGGVAVTITGTGFDTVSDVTFGGSAATDVVTVNPTTVTCTTPAHAAGAVNVVVTNGDAQTGTGVNVFTYLVAPTVTSVFPAAGPPFGGTPVTITGTGFVEVSGVTFDGVAATNVVTVSLTQVTCWTPAGSLGAVDVVVTNVDDQTGTGVGAYTYTAVAARNPPKLMSMGIGLRLS
jgi:hypothetical protein